MLAVSDAVPVTTISKDANKLAVDEELAIALRY